MISNHISVNKTAIKGKNDYTHWGKYFIYYLNSPESEKLWKIKANTVKNMKPNANLSEDLWCAGAKWGWGLFTLIILRIQ